jgi:DNA-directed RNA polymerase specialized sigma subunit
LGFNIAIKSELLAEALRLLPERQRDIVMGYYFLGMSDRAIGEESNARRSTVGYQRNISIEKVKRDFGGITT